MVVESGTFSYDTLIKAKTATPDPLLRRGCAYYIKMFGHVKFVVKENDIFIDMIGEELERRILDIPMPIFGMRCTTSHKTLRVYVWGVSLNIETNNYNHENKNLKAELERIHSHYTDTKANNKYHNYMSDYYTALLEKM
tara:strand:+ start:112 stop:528 length:417 start_codon:yes stop_codon:yes gene_type:complete